MTTLAYSTVISEMQAHVPALPDLVAIPLVNKIVIDLCERTHAWRTTLTDKLMVAGTSNYTLVSPVADTEVVAVHQAMVVLTTAAVRRKLEVLTVEQAYDQYPDWPNTATPGEPKAVWQSDFTSYNVGPVPGTADTYNISVRASIRPTQAATGCDTMLYNEFRRAIFHGVLYEAMMMKNVPWADMKLAEVHGRQWTHLVSTARAKVNAGFGKVPLVVRMNPWR